MKILTCKYKLKSWFIATFAVFMILSCTQDIETLVRVEVVTAGGVPVNGAVITLTNTLGTLGAATLTTVNGVATTLLQAGDTAGTAYVVATVENITATTTVPILNF